MTPVWLLSIVARTGIPARLQKSAAMIVTILMFLAVVALIVTGIRHALADQRHEAVTLDRAAIDAEVAGMALGAEQGATRNQMVRDEIAADNEKEIDREVDKGDARAVGPGTAAVLQRMRDQQVAGRR